MITSRSVLFGTIGVNHHVVPVGFIQGHGRRDPSGDLTSFSLACKCFASDIAMQVTTDAVQRLRLRARSLSAARPAT
jgi:hypothetical protein